MDQFKFVKPLRDEDSFKRYESQFGVKVPKSFITFSRKNNGSRPIRKNFDCKECKGHVIKTFLSFNEADRENMFNSRSLLDTKHKSLIPFASDPSGNLICFDDNSNVVLWLHEEDRTVHICKSFNEFLIKLY